jgi:hypothetical protein
VTPAWSADLTWQAALGASLLAAATALHPRYSASPDYREYVDLSKWQGQAPVRALHRWIRAETSPSDVFFAYAPLDKFGTFSPLMLQAWLVAPAGRKVVALGAGYSNPYVDFAQRQADFVRLWRALQSSDADGFLALADRYHVEYVIYIDDNGSAPPEELAVSWLAQVYPPASPEAAGGIEPTAAAPGSAGNVVDPIVVYEIRR